MWPFKQKKAAGSSVLIYETGEDFLDYHCRFMDTELMADKPLAALVLDARNEFGTEVAVKRNEQGIQIAAVRVASDDGGFVTVSQTLSAQGEQLSPGDVVAWVPAPYSDEIAKLAGNEQSGWVGLIVAKVAPKIKIASDQMKVICRY